MVQSYLMSWWRVKIFENGLIGMIDVDVDAGVDGDAGAVAGIADEKAPLPPPPSCHSNSNSYLKSTLSNEHQHHHHQKRSTNYHTCCVASCIINWCLNTEGLRKEIEQQADEDDDDDDCLSIDDTLSVDSYTVTSDYTMSADEQQQQQQNTKCSHNRRVTFSTVEVREYACVIGDHPHCAHLGLPLSLDWKFNPNTLVYDVEDSDLYQFNFDRPRKLSFSERKNRLKVVSGVDFEGDLMDSERPLFMCIDSELPPEDEEQENSIDNDFGEASADVLDIFITTESQIHR